MAGTPLYLRLKDKLRKAFVFTPWPMNPNGRPYMAFMANVLFRENPNPNILETIPDGATNATSVETEGLQGSTNQGNKTTDWIETGGYAMDSSPAPAAPTGLAVVSPISVPNYNQGDVVKKILGELSWAEAVEIIKPLLNIVTPEIPPTAPPDVWRDFVHYEEVANDAGVETIKAVVDNASYLPDDTPVPAVTNPQADVTITATGDQTITLAENQFTVVGGTKALSAQRWSESLNSSFALPTGVTFNPSTRDLTFADSFVNQTVSIRIFCQDILGQTNWDTFDVIINRAIPANTVQYVQARFVVNGLGPGPSNDLLEVQMMDGYADQPMYYDVLLSSAPAPTSFGTLFERGVPGAGHIRSLQLANGNFKSKTFKVYISRATSGAANIGVYTFTTGSTSTSGFVTLS